MRIPWGIYLTGKGADFACWHVVEFAIRRVTDISRKRQNRRKMVEILCRRGGQGDTVSV